ncbi:MAG: hypothetical protein WCL38_02915 [Actinomycetota bacterium]
MQENTKCDWTALSAQVARSVQTTVGWIFWDPGAVERYQALGLPSAIASPLGYIAARCAPLASAGPDAVIAAFGSISPLAIRGLFGFLGDASNFSAFAAARDEAVVEGLESYTPEFAKELALLGSGLWSVVDELPDVGRVLFAAHRGQARPENQVLSAWHAVNAIREWRGDTHWALIAAGGLDAAEASILHNAWLGYERDWIPKSRGLDDVALEKGWASLREKGLANEDGVTEAGLDLREVLERETDRLSAVVWQSYGEAATRNFCTLAEPPCSVLLERVDLTAGPNYQPGSRTRRARSEDARRVDTGAEQ